MYAQVHVWNGVLVEVSRKVSEVSAPLSSCWGMVSHVSVATLHTLDQLACELLILLFSFPSFARTAGIKMKLLHPAFLCGL